MRHKVASLGFSLIEALVSIGIIVLLLLAVCSAVIQTLRVEAMHTGRAAMGRTASQLAERLQEEARSSTAVFIPSLDVLGNSNSESEGAHEVDLFRRLSAGGDAFVAYRFDSASGAVTRYEYSSVLGIKTILNSDLAGSGIASFVGVRKPVADSELVAGQADPVRVSILYGTPELVGGNDVVIVSLATQESGGAPSEKFTVHLATRSAPTSLAILAPAGPPATPPPTRVIRFVILRPGFQLPHGPKHNGDPGDPSNSIHWVAATGSAQFFGNGPDLAGTWFEMSLLYNMVSSGTYVFKNADGSSVTATINCDGGICPSFHPLPLNAPGLAPSGGVAFQSTF